MPTAPKKNASGSTVQYCRGVEDIARALGIRLLEQRNRKAKQLAEIRDWTNNVGLPTGAPPFPVKQANGYWLRAEVVAWGNSRLNLTLNQPGKDGGNGEIKSKSKIKNAEPELPEQPELPAQENGNGDSPFGALSPEMVAAANKERLQRNLKVHLGLVPAMTPLRKFEVDELVANGLLPKKDTPDDEGEFDDRSVNIGKGFRGVSNYINRNFPWVHCNHTKVQRWVESDSLPSGCKEPFPPPDDGNRFKRAQVDAWVERWCPAPKAFHQSLPIMDIDAARDQADLEKWAHERWLRESERQATDKNYIRVDVMLGIADEVGNAAYQAVYQSERDRVRLFEVDAEVQAAPEVERNRWLAIVRRLMPEASRIIVAEQTKGFRALKERAET